MHFQWQDHHFIAGRRCLDFVNTVVYARDPRRREDRLQSLSDIEHWLACSPAGALAIPAGGYAGERFFLEAMRARAAIDQIFRASARGEAIDAAAWRDLMAILAAVTGGPDIAVAATAEGLEVRGDGCTAPPFLGSITHDAITLALSPRLPRVKECPGCHWLFVDATRNGRKRWCEMRTCGNRAKAMRYSDRLRAGAPKSRVGR